MATQIQWRKGTTAQHSTFTGALGEVTVDTDKDTLVVHDSSTVGGFPLAKAGANSDITSLSGVTTALSVSQGGTGATTHTANNILVGSGSSAISSIAPGTSGNVLLSNGTTWTSASNPTPSKIQSITCTQTGGALTFTLNPCVLDFRSTTLTTGVPVTRTVSAPITLTVPSGGTLGSVITIAANLIPVAIDNAGTVELAVINLSGGNDLSEMGVINTTAVSASSTSSTVFYSTTARTGVAYRVVGSVTAVNTVGAWGNPTLVQGRGGQALTAMGSAGFGQTWQNVAGSRAILTTYYSSPYKEIDVMLTIRSTSGSLTININIDGVLRLAVDQQAANYGASASFSVPAGKSYSVTIPSGTGASILTWSEKR